MGWYPGAVRRPIVGGTDGPMAAHVGAVLHVNDSTGNLFNWVNGGTHNMSCHFEIYASGVVEQYLDTAVDSWCQMDGNKSYVSIETEGYPTEAFTDAQVVAIAKLLVWLHAEHGIPLVLAEAPGQPGLGWHGMGGAAWGNHPGCPGDPRKNARSAILRLTGYLTAPQTSSSKEIDDVYVNLQPGQQGVVPVEGLKQLLMSTDLGGVGVRAVAFDAHGKARPLVTGHVPINKKDPVIFWLSPGPALVAAIPAGATSVSFLNLGKHALGVRGL